MPLSNCKSNFLTWASVGGGLAASFWSCRKIACYIQQRRTRLYFEEKCKTWPKDTVIVHGVRRGKLSPHISPFVLKLETFLRMHKIPYIFDSEFPMGDKGKMPWITLNGEHYTDSQLIIKFLTKKYDLKPKGNYSDIERATGTLVRVVADEHIFWGIVLWRYVYAQGEQLGEIFNMTGNELKALETRIRKNFMGLAWGQGIGRHEKHEVIELISEDLRAISIFMGSKNFLLGDEPCDDDCAVFGILAMFIWNDIKSPFTKLIYDELPNLKDYCLRMKELYWEDWDNVIQAASTLPYIRIQKPAN